MFTNLLAAVVTDPDVRNHVQRMSSTDGALVQDVTQLILNLKSSGLWAKIDVLCVVHDNAADSLLNLRGLSAGADSLNVNSCSFTANQGYTTNSASNRHISLVESESSAVLYGTGSGHMLLYSRSVMTGYKTVMSGNGSITRIMFNESTASPDEVYAWMQSSTYYNSIVYDIPKGCVITALKSSTLVSRVNDTADSDAHSSPAALSTNPFILGGLNNPASTQVDLQFAAWGVGGGLTAAEIAVYENHIRTYMQARGAAVF